MAQRLLSVLVALPLLALVGVSMAACGGDGDKGGTSAASPTRPPATSAPAAVSPTAAAAANPTQAPAGAANSVTIADFSYSPARLNARAGQQLQLTVTNGGNVSHTFTIQGVTDSGTISPGTNKVVTFTPSTAGTLIYFCTIHGQSVMSGQITVAGTTGSAPPPDAPAGGQSTGGSTSSPPATPATTGGYDYNY